MSAFLGLDLGTSSLKAVLATGEGRVLARREAAYATQRPHPGWAEQDPDDWWAAACRATRELLRDASVHVAGIGLSGQMHTAVLVAEDGRPVRPAITWMDTRAASLLGELHATLTERGLQPRLANPVALGLSLPALAWLRRHEPRVLAESVALLSAKDHLRWRLTGELGAEPTDASATLLFDVPARQWLPETAALLERPPSWLPELGAPDAVAGRLREGAASELGLPAGIPVAYGAGDQQAAAVGLGCVDDGQLQLMVGTGAQALAVRDAPLVDPEGRLHLFCHVQGWIQQASLNNAGNALGWVRSVLGTSWAQLHAAPDRGGAAPTFVPYLLGERAHAMLPQARGAWLGLAPDHDRDDLARAAVVGVVASIAEGVALLRAAGATRDVIRAAGGGLRHARFAQDAADAIGSPFEVADVRDASALGAALLGGVAAGTFPDLHAAVVGVRSAPVVTYAPDPARAERWAARRRALREVDASGVHEAVARAMMDA
jgi:xylulokinase